MLLILCTLLLTVGFYCLSAQLLHIPTMAASRAFLLSNKAEKRKEKKLEAWLDDTAIRLSTYIRLDAYRMARMEAQMKAAGMVQTPQVFMANALVRAFAIFLLIIPVLMIFPLASPVILILSMLTYFKYMQSADEKVRERRDELESELPRFAATLAQHLKSSRDILTMLEQYKKTAGIVLSEELEFTIADMRSGGYEAALTRMEARINSPQLSDIVRGLIAVIRGDDGEMYFQMLTHDFKAMELQRLKSKAQKIPPKIRIYSFLMLMCFLITYLAIILYEVVVSLGSMLG